MSDIARLGCTSEETAYHEAGHAAIELIHGYTPQLLVVKDQTGEISGECLSCAPTGPEHAAWHGEKAIAGVLAQSLYLAGHCLGLARVLIPTSATSELVCFFLTPPTATGTCVVTLSSEDHQQGYRVDLCGCYSLPDYQHFRISVAELTEQQYVGQKFSGDEPECFAAAEQCVTRCVGLLNNSSVWRHLAKLAEAILATQPQTAHLLYRDGIERAAGSLGGINRPNRSHGPPT